MSCDDVIGLISEIFLQTKFTDDVSVKRAGEVADFKILLKFKSNLHLFLQGRSYGTLCA